MLQRIGQRPPHYTRLKHGTFEVRRSGAARFDLRDPFHLAVEMPWGAFAATALLALLTLNLIFAGLYVASPMTIRGAPSGDFAHAFFFSLETMSTVGYGEMSPLSPFGYAVAACEIVVGMAFVALLTGLLFFRFSQSRAGLVFAERAVVCAHNGLPTLMVRVGNANLGMLTDATAALSVLLRETSAEGQLFRRYRDLMLICSRLPAFPLTWTVMHVIDEASPLHGYDPVRLQADWGRLFLSVEAHDPKLGRRVQDLADYGHDHILFGADYVEATTYDEQGVATADLSLLGHVRLTPSEGRVGGGGAR